MNLEKRRVTISILGQPFSFFSDDPDAYIAALEKKVNEALREARGRNNAVLAVILLADRLLRMDQQPRERETRKPRPVEKDDGQVSIWDLLDEQRSRQETQTAEKDDSQVSVWDLLDE